MERDYYVEETPTSKAFEASLEEIVKGFESGKIEGDRTVKKVVDGNFRSFTVTQLCMDVRNGVPVQESQPVEQQHGASGIAWATIRIVAGLALIFIPILFSENPSVLAILVGGWIIGGGVCGLFTR